jgi:hypothetical protein
MDSLDVSPAGREAAPQTVKVLRYAVIVCGSEWRVLSGRSQIGRYASRAGAMAVAVNLTRQALEAGHAAELYAQDEGGDFLLHPLFPPGP